MSTRDELRERVIREITVAPGWNKPDATALVDELLATPPAPPPHTRLILASENLLDIWGTRTERGERITVEWGEQKPEGWYEPVFTVHSDDVLATPPEPLDVERLARALHEWPKHTAGHHFDTCPYEQGYRQEAARVAAEYARLSAQEDAP